MPSSNGKEDASSKGKSANSSKGKSAAPPFVDSNDEFMPSSKAKRVASSESKGV
jgi:hypothetical protein